MSVSPRQPSPATPPRSGAVQWSKVGAVRPEGTPPTASSAEQPSLDTSPVALAGLVRRPAPAVWWVVGGVVVSTLVALLVDSRLGIFTLAGTCAAAGVARAILPEPGPEGISIRTQGLDLFFFFSFAAALALLAIIAPAA